MPFEQLDLPLRGLSVPPSQVRIPRSHRVFVNRNLKMASVDWVGFDMDYTLAIYNQAEMDHLSVRTTLEKLVDRGYPEVLAELEYRIDFPIRGLLIDKRKGHILKMDKFKHVQKGYHGLRELTQDELRALYHSKKLRPTTTRYHWIDTLYALSEATLYAGIVDALEARSIPVNYVRLFTDIRECIDEAHRDGTIVDRVAADLPRYVDRDPDLAQTLHKLRSAGKKLFLLTNSHWSFSEKMMSYLLDGAMPEYPTFRHYFDVLVVAAKKPTFFEERPPLMRIVGDELKPASAPLERGAVYQGGNLIDLERALGVTGDRILYVGDHIYGDILRSKKESAWRTAMIIQEMEAEVEAHEACLAQHQKGEELWSRRDELEDQLRHYQSRFKDLTRRLGESSNGGNGSNNGNGKARNSGNGGNGGSVDAAANDDAAASELDQEPTPSSGTLHLQAERGRVKRSVERVRGALRAINAEARKIESEIDRQFHPYWGSLLKEGHEKSCFGGQVEEYACIYTSRVSNLLLYSPLQYYRSARDRMPHEL